MIPAYNHNQVLPPVTGDPTIPHNLSPYNCTTLDLVQRFSTSVERINILRNFISFRSQIRANGMVDRAFQWIDGSFLEDIEHKEMRAPRDIDVLTFYYGYTMQFQNNLVAQLPEFANPMLAKQNYFVDHYPIQIDWDPIHTFEVVRYWTMLFNHNRDQVWKGLLRVELDTEVIDQDAVIFLNGVII